MTSKNKIRSLNIAMGLILASSSSAFTQTPSITLTPLSGPIYLVEDAHYAKTNSLIYVGPSYVSIIGATWSPETARMLAQQIKQLTSRPIREVIDTSPDPEWSGGNAYWKGIGAQVIAAKATCGALRTNWDATVARTQKSFPNFPRLPLSEPSECDSNNFDLQDGNIKVIYLGPSHTEADVFVYFPQQRVLDASSILKEQLGNLANANTQEYPKTLRKLQAMHLNIATIISGHWSPIHGPELIETYLDLLRQAGHQPAMIEADVRRAAHKMIELYDLDAGRRAGLRADQLYEEGDVDGFNVWVRIVRAIKELQQIEPCDKDMRHYICAPCREGSGGGFRFNLRNFGLVRDSEPK